MTLVLQVAIVALLASCFFNLLVRVPYVVMLGAIGAVVLASVGFGYSRLHTENHGIGLAILALLGTGLLLAIVDEIRDFS
ncbi:MAG TPA: hypothetical protein VEA81_17100, partial [Burkholderiaceae bacterium]|nr:hypothetical protein [Burkholderiaceae bacterium]